MSGGQHETGFAFSEPDDASSLDDGPDESDGPAAAQVLSSAWSDWCDRLKATGLGISAGTYCGTDARTQAEGFRALTRQLVYSLQMEMEGGNPLHPEFIRYEDPWTQWGGPNPDNVYLRATIDPGASYRVWGDVTGVQNLIMSLHEGDMHLDQYGVFSEETLESLALADGRLEVVISPDVHEGNWMQTTSTARLLMIRIYIEDWESDPIPTLHIERIGTEGVPPAPPTPQAISAALDRSMTWIERSLPYWAQLLSGILDKHRPNIMSPARSAPAGLQALMYGTGRWELGTGGALIITSDVPDADYWGWSIHTAPWFDSGDYANRQTSITGSSLHVDADGKVRIVLSQRDPGVPNWIDTECRASGLVLFRLVGARCGIAPTCAVAPVVDVASLMPAGHPTVTPVQRREQLRKRRASVARRVR